MTNVYEGATAQLIAWSNCVDSTSAPQWNLVLVGVARSAH